MPQPRSHTDAPITSSAEELVAQLRDLHAALVDWSSSMTMFEEDSERRVDASRLALAGRHLAKALALLDDPEVVESGALEGGLLLSRLLHQMEDAELEVGGSLTQGHRGDGLVLAEFLGFLANGRRSGIVTAHTRSEHFVLELTGGALVYAHGDAGEERFGDILVSQGAIERDELELWFEEKVQRPGEFLGQALVRVEAITPDDLASGVEEQMRRTLVRLLGMPDVRFAFEPDLSLVAEPVVRWNVTGVLLDLARQSDEDSFGALGFLGEEDEEEVAPAGADLRDLRSGDLIHPGDDSPRRRADDVEPLCEEVEWLEDEDDEVEPAA